MQLHVFSPLMNEVRGSILFSLYSSWQQLIVHLICSIFKTLVLTGLMDPKWPNVCHSSEQPSRPTCSNRNITIHLYSSIRTVFLYLVLKCSITSIADIPTATISFVFVSPSAIFIIIAKTSGTMSLIYKLNR